jgi:hypothetical protein
MARYERNYDGERRTVHMSFYGTPSEAAEVDAGRVEQGITRSDFLRELVFRRLAARPDGIGKADVVAIKRELESSQHANNAVGNLLNQLARHANTTGELGSERLAELDDAIALARRASELYIAALTNVISL